MTTLEIYTNEQAREWYNLYLQCEELEYEVAERENRLWELRCKMFVCKKELVDITGKDKFMKVYPVTNEKYEVIYLVAGWWEGDTQVEVVE